MSSEIQQVESFSFNTEDLKLLISTIRLSLKNEANESESYGRRNRAYEVFRSNEEIQSHKLEYRRKKHRWIDSWSEKVCSSLSIKERLLNEKEVKARFAAKEGKSRKITTFAVEFANFTPYYDLAGDLQKEHGLKFTNDDKRIYYECIAALSEYRIRLNDLKTAGDSFEDCIKGMGRIVSGKSHSLSLMGVGLLVAALLVDPIAGGIGAAMELSGGAAFLAGLAFLGGGAIASGGFGITGGLLIIMAGGAIIGYGAGSAEYDLRLKKSSKEQLYLHCGKLFSFAKTADLSKDEFKQICSKTFDLQKEFEEEADHFAINQTNPSQKIASEEKAKVLAAFRKYIRSTFE